MKFADVTGGPLVEALRESAPAADREQLYGLLLVEPLLVAVVGPQAPRGPTIKLSSGEVTRLVDAPALRVPVAPLFITGAAMAAWGNERELWSDGVERGERFDTGAIFPILRGLPGALVVGGDRPLPLDAGEVAALAEKQSPGEYRAAIKALVTRGRPREAAKRLSTRPLYVLGHPKGGMVTFQRDIPAFFHLAEAEAFANKLGDTTGQRPQHGLVAATDLFANAFRGKLNLVIGPGKDAITLKGVDLRL